MSSRQSFGVAFSVLPANDSWAALLPSMHINSFATAVGYALQSYLSSALITKSLGALQSITSLRVMSVQPLKELSDVSGYYTATFDFEGSRSSRSALMEELINSFSDCSLYVDNTSFSSSASWNQTGRYHRGENV